MILYDVPSDTSCTNVKIIFATLMPRNPRDAFRGHSIISINVYTIFSSMSRFRIRNANQSVEHDSTVYSKARSSANIESKSHR